MFGTNRVSLDPESFPLKEIAVEFGGRYSPRLASAHPVAQGGLDLRARMQRTEDGDGGDGCAGQFGGDVVRNGDQAEHIDPSITARLSFTWERSNVTVPSGLAVIWFAGSWNVAFAVFGLKLALP